MSFSSALLVTAIAGLSLVSALPTANDNMGPGMASIVQVRNENYIQNGAVSVYKTYSKYNVTIPDSLSQAVFNATNGRLGKRGKTSGSGVLNVGDSYDGAYLCPVSIGTPAQTLNLQVDTGSSDLWVFSSELASSSIKGQKIYTPTKSSTAKKQAGQTWGITYGDGSNAKGDIFSDVVSIGGFSVPSQAVECAQQVSDDFAGNSGTHGLLGLGFDNINTAQPKAVSTYFTNAKAALAAPVFTADLKHQAPGTLNFGYINSSLYTGSITYAPVTGSNGFWEWTSSGFSIGTGIFSKMSITGIADTGSSLMYLPDNIVNAYYKQVKGATNNPSSGGWVFPCSSILPSFSFGVGNAKITVPAKYLSYGQISNTDCFGGLQSSANIGINIFGDVALKSAFVVFNGGSSPTIGFASKKLT